MSHVGPGFTGFCGVDAGTGAGSLPQGDVTVHLVGEPRWVNARWDEIAHRKGNAAALAQAFGEDGRDMLRHISGHFALAIADHANSRALIATDRIGSRALYYSHSNGKLFFSTRADCAGLHLNVANSVSHQAIYNYLFFEMIPGPDAIFGSVHRLLPSQYLWMDLGQIRVDTYWHASYQPLKNSTSDGELQEQFRELVRASILDAATEGRALGRIGAFLSGGTDSSTVAGMLAQSSEEPVDTFSIGFAAKGYDETEYARLAARHFGTRHHEYYVTPKDVVDAVPRIAASMDQPFGNASIVPAWYCARMAREQGIDCLLAGDGGDELFGGNERYAKQLMFEHYARIPKTFRRALIEPLLLSPSSTRRIPVVKKARSYVEQALIPLPDRMHTYNLLERLGGIGILAEQWQEQVDAGRPMQLVRSAYSEAYADHVLNRMLAVDMRFTLADSDLPKVNAACDLAGVAVRYPWLDQRLVDFAAALPVNQKVRGVRLRHLFKEALKDFLPREIITKSKHGFGLPFGLWLDEDKGLRDLAGDSLRGLETRGILRAGFIDQLLGEHHRTHAAYYGTFVWILMMLEQWLATRESEPPK